MTLEIEALNDPFTNKDARLCRAFQKLGMSENDYRLYRSVRVSDRTNARKFLNTLQYLTNRAKQFRESERITEKDLQLTIY